MNLFKLNNSDSHAFINLDQIVRISWLDNSIHYGAHGYRSPVGLVELSNGCDAFLTREEYDAVMAIINDDEYDEDE